MSDAITFLWRFILLSVLAMGAAFMLLIIIMLVYGAIASAMEVITRPLRLRRLRKRILKDRA